MFAVNNNVDSWDTALRDIKELIDMAILIANNAGGRSTSYRLNSGSSTL